MLQHLQILVWIIIFSIFSHAEVLTKKAAVDSLKKSGLRYRQIEINTLSAESQTMLAESALGAHVTATSREVIAKINQLQYGSNTPGNLDWIAFGSTGVAAFYNIYDKASDERAKAARFNEKAVKQNSEQYKTELTFALLAQYLNAQRLQKKLATSEANIARNEELKKAVETKIKVGAGLELDLMRVNNLIEFEKIKKIDAENSLFKAKQDIANLIHRENAEFETTPLQLSKIDSQSILTKDRHDLLASKTTIEAAQHFLEFHKSEKKPKVSLLGQAGFDGPYVISSSEVFTGMIGIQVSMPLWDAGLNKATEQDASAKFDLAVLNSKQLEEDIKTQKEVARRQLQNAEKLVELSDRQIKTSENELELVKRRYKAGASTSLELSNAEANVASAYDSNVEAIFTYEIAKLNYYKTFGSFEDYLTREVQP